MAECCICKKELSHITAYYYNYKGKNYCRNCYNKVTAKDLEKKKKEKHIEDAKRTILKEYNTKPREFMLHLITVWRPRGCKSETDYTSSLKKFLDSELSPVDIYVGKESSGGLDSSRLDLAVGKKKPYREFAIELKKNLKSSSEFDRLKGQIHTYIIGKFKHIIILLIGKTESKLETELNTYKKEMLDHYRTLFTSLNSIDVIKK